MKQLSKEGKSIALRQLDYLALTANRNLVFNNKKHEAEELSDSDIAILTSIIMEVSAVVMEIREEVADGH